ncbi:putative SKP1-like protein 1B-like [Capsicum annuum]|nr:putative SKP1-like protein 1B-like [Capsicum annuum]
MTHVKPNVQWVTNASVEVNDKMKDVIVEKVQEIEKDTDMDPIINAAFVQVVGEKSKYILGQGYGIKSASRISRNEIQEQLKARQKEAEDERRK